MSGRAESILLVEDDRRQREEFSDMLSRLGYEVTPADSHDAALACAGSFDIALIDTVISQELGKQGYDLCRRIKERCRMPVIAMSSSPNDFYREKWEECGAETFLSKDDLRKDPSMIDRLIKEALEKYRSGRGL